MLHCALREQIKHMSSPQTVRDAKDRNSAIKPMDFGTKMLKTFFKSWCYRGTVGIVVTNRGQMTTANIKFSKHR